MIKKIITFLFIVAVLFGLYKIISKKPSSDIIPTATPDTDLILFYGSTCPHCKVVEDFISNNQVDQKLKISQFEVYEDKSNSSLFYNIVKKICPEKINANGLSVPFLVSQKENKCTVGDTTITEYLLEKLN